MSFSQLTEFCYKNILQIFSVGSGNIKMSRFLDVRGTFLKGMMFLKRSFNLILDLKFNILGTLICNIQRT